MSSHRNQITAAAAEGGWFVAASDTGGLVIQRKAEQVVIVFTKTVAPFATAPEFRRAEVSKLSSDGDMSVCIGTLTGVELVLDYLTH
jgi:hypothetical protein